MRSLYLHTVLVFAGGLGIHGSAAAQETSRALTPTDLNMMARLSEPQVSPDGRLVVYVQRETDREANRGRTDLWLVDSTSDARAQPRRLTQHSATDNHPRWSVDGTGIYFLSSRAGSMQVWRLPLAGGEAVQITDYPLDIGSFSLSPDGARIAVSMDVFPDCADLSCTRERLDDGGAEPPFGPQLRFAVRAALGHVEKRHALEPVRRAAQPGRTRRSAGQRQQGARGRRAFQARWAATRNTPSAPTARASCSAARVAGREEPWSTNFDLFEALVDGTAAPRNLTADNPAWDTQPKFLRNGALAWIAMTPARFRGGSLSHSHLAQRQDARRGAGLGPLRPAPRRLARRTLAAGDRERPRTDRVVLDRRRQRTRDADCRARAPWPSSRPPRRVTSILWHDLGTPPDSVPARRTRRAAPAHERERESARRDARCRSSSSSASRDGTTRPSTAT